MLPTLEEYSQMTSVIAAKDHIQKDGAQTMVHVGGTGSLDHGQKYVNSDVKFLAQTSMEY